MHVTPRSTVANGGTDKIRLSIVSKVRCGGTGVSLQKMVKRGVIDANALPLRGNAPSFTEARNRWSKTCGQLSTVP